MKILSLYLFIFSIFISLSMINAAMISTVKIEASAIKFSVKNENREVQAFEKDQNEEENSESSLTLKADHLDNFLRSSEYSYYFDNNYADKREGCLLPNWEEIETLLDAHYQKLEKQLSDSETLEEEDDEIDQSSEDENDNDSDDLNFNYSSCDESEEQEGDEDPRSYKCNVKGCDRAFIYKNNLMFHKQEEHNLKIYKCTYPGCKKIYHIHTSLLYHVRKHKNDLRYQCFLCKRRFLQKGGLNAHMRAAHTREKPFNCSKCNKLFSEKHNRDRHEKMYCDKRYV